MSVCEVCLLFQLCRGGGEGGVMYDDNESNERDPKSTGRVINSGGYCWLDQIQFIVPQLVVQRLYIYTIDTLPFLLSLS